MTETTNTNPERFATPYQAAKFANQLLKEAGLKPIPPQMMYNYTTSRIAKGEEPLIEGRMSAEGKFEVDKEDLVRWTRRRIAKKTTGNPDPEQLTLF